MQNLLGQDPPQPKLPTETPTGTTQSFKTPSSKSSQGRGLVFGIGIGVVLTLLAGKFIFPSSPASNQTIAEQQETIQKTGPSQSVTVTTVKNSPVNRTIEGTGTVSAAEIVSVLAQATGLQIRQILVDEGQFISRGQVLALLDDRIQKATLIQRQASVLEAEARLAELNAGSRQEEIASSKETINRIEAEIIQARSDLDLAQRRAERNRNLEAEGAITQDRLDELVKEERNKRATLDQTTARLREAKQGLALLEAGPRRETIAQAAARLAEAKADLQIAKTELERTRILAPASGKIFERNARVGQTTTSSNSLFEIIEDGLLELQVNLPETLIPQIRLGQVVKITSDADSRLKLQGRVEEIEPIVDAESRQAIVKVTLPQGTGLKPGMFLRAAIVTSTTNSLTVPMDAVLPQDDGSAITYILQPNQKVQAQSVILGEILPNQQIEIKSGLQSGQQVVVKGAPYLKDGANVSLVNETVLNGS